MTPEQTIYLTMLLTMAFFGFLMWKSGPVEPEDIEPDVTPYDEEEWR